MMRSVLKFMQGQLSASPSRFCTISGVTPSTAPTCHALGETIKRKTTTLPSPTGQQYQLDACKRATKLLSTEARHALTIDMHLRRLSNATRGDTRQAYDRNRSNEQQRPGSDGQRAASAADSKQPYPKTTASKFHRDCEATLKQHNQESVLQKFMNFIQGTNAPMKHKRQPAAFAQSKSPCKCNKQMRLQFHAGCAEKKKPNPDKCVYCGRTRKKKSAFNKFLTRLHRSSRRMRPLLKHGQRSTAPRSKPSQGNHSSLMYVVDMLKAKSGFFGMQPGRCYTQDEGKVNCGQCAYCRNQLLKRQLLQKQLQCMPWESSEVRTAENGAWLSIQSSHKVEQPASSVQSWQNKSVVGMNKQLSPADDRESQTVPSSHEMYLRVKQWSQQNCDSKIQFKSPEPAKKQSDQNKLRSTDVAYGKNKFSLKTYWDRSMNNSISKYSTHQDGSQTQKSVLKAAATQPTAKSFIITKNYSKDTHKPILNPKIVDHDLKKYVQKIRNENNLRNCMGKFHHSKQSVGAVVLAMKKKNAMSEQETLDKLDKILKSRKKANCN